MFIDLVLLKKETHSLLIYPNLCRQHKQEDLRKDRKPSPVFSYLKVLSMCSLMKFVYWRFIMRKRFAFILTVILILTSIFPSNVLAYGTSQGETYQSTVSICQERAELFLQNVGHPATVSNPVTLKNFANEAEAILFETSTGGYIIVNINDLSIPELSLVNSNPFSDCESPIYNGPLGYYYAQNDAIKSVIDNTIVNVQQNVEYYTRQKVEDLQGYLTSLRQASGARYVIVEEYLSAPLKKWCIDGNNCGSIASAICMRWYYDNVSTSYVNSNSISENSLIALMQNYVGVGLTGYSDLVNGLNSYFDSRNVDNTAARTSTFSFSRVKRSILDDRPIIVGTLDHPTFRDHWIIAHGYFESRVDGNYIIVNDGWRSNDVWVEPNTTTFDGTIYFAN